jgi:hypothetical protein
MAQLIGIAWEAALMLIAGSVRLFGSDVVVNFSSRRILKRSKKSLMMARVMRIGLNDR